MRLLGPNSMGLLAPWQGLNASFSPVPITRGKLAFISQSAAVSNTILDWAQQREMGFSYFIALGDSLDIDVDELLDFLARDQNQRHSALSRTSKRRAPVRLGGAALRAINRFWSSRVAVAPKPSGSCKHVPGWIRPGMRPFSVPVAARAGYS
jgi:hypothetical protein